MSSGLGNVNTKVDNMDSDMDLCSILDDTHMK